MPSAQAIKQFNEGLKSTQEQLKKMQMSLGLDEDLKDEDKGEGKDEGEAGGLTLEALAAQIRVITEFLDKLKPMEEAEHGVQIDADLEEEEIVADADLEVAGGMDAADVSKMIVASNKGLLRSIAKRDALADKLSSHIGTFDHKEMTLAEVAAYGAKKLDLKASPGQELPMVEGYLAAAKQSTGSFGVVKGSGQDAAPKKSGKVLAYLNGK